MCPVLLLCIVSNVIPVCTGSCAWVDILYAQGGDRESLSRASLSRSKSCILHSRYIQYLPEKQQNKVFSGICKRERDTRRHGDTGYLTLPQILLLPLDIYRCMYLQIAQTQCGLLLSYYLILITQFYSILKWQIEPLLDWKACHLKRLLQHKKYI